MSKVPREDVLALKQSGQFDSAWYSSAYPDVQSLGMDPAEHYLWIGRRMGRASGPDRIGARDEKHASLISENKSAESPANSADWTRADDGFDPRSYILANPDLQSLSTPQQLAEHWQYHGLNEARIGSGISPYFTRRPWNGALSAATLKVAFFGPISALSGLGSAARGYVKALASLKIKLEVIDTTASLYPDKEGSIASPSTSPDIVILLQNPDSLGNLFRLIDRRLLDGAFTIGLWVWEVMAFRPEWIEAFGAVDEIWTPSPFVTEAIETAAPA